MQSHREKVLHPGYRSIACLIVGGILIVVVVLSMAAQSTSGAPVEFMQLATSPPTPGECFTVISPTLKAGSDGWLIQSEIFLFNLVEHSDLLDTIKTEGDAELQEALLDRFEISWSIPSDADKYPLQIVRIRPVTPQKAYLMFDMHPTVGVVGDERMSDKEQAQWSELLWNVVLAGLSADDGKILPTTVVCSNKCNDFDPGSPIADPSRDRKVVFGLASDALFSAGESETWPDSCPSWPADEDPVLRVVLRLNPDDLKSLLLDDTVNGLAEKIRKRYCNNLGRFNRDGVVVLLLLREPLGQQRERIKTACTSLTKEASRLAPQFHAQCVSMTSLDSISRPDHWRSVMPLQIDIRSTVMLRSKDIQNAGLTLRYKDPTCLSKLIPLNPDVDSGVDQMIPNTLILLSRGLVFCLMIGIFLGYAFFRFRKEDSEIRSKLIDKFELDDDPHCG